MKNNKKKVVIAAEIFPPDIGGPATYAQKLAEHLGANEFDVVVVTYGNTQKKLPATDYRLLVTSHKIPLPFRYWVYALKLFIVSKNADVIYAQGPLSAGWPAGKVVNLIELIKLTKRPRFVVKVVGDQAWERAMQLGKTEKLLDEFQKEKITGKIKQIQRIQQNVLKNADAVITVSNWFKVIIAGWGIESKKVHVVHNTITPHSRLASAENLHLYKGGLGLDGDIILTVARLTKWKGIDMLINLMPQLLKENSRFKLVIVGEGPEYENYKLQIINNKLENSVLLAGKKSKDELAEYYRQAMVFVLNSGYENWSHVTLEAMSYGIPVIISKIGGNPELVKHEVTGLLVDYNNKVQLKTAVSRIWLNKDLREKLINNAKEQVDVYTFLDMVDKTLEILLNKK